MQKDGVTNEIVGRRARLRIKGLLPVRLCTEVEIIAAAPERELVRRFTLAYEAGDVRQVVALLTEDAWLVMPPVPLRYQGRELAARFPAPPVYVRAVSMRSRRFGSFEVFSPSMPVTRGTSPS